MECPRPRDQRSSVRFDKVFEVLISSADFGEVSACARNISTGGMQIETPCVLPLGSEVRVRFQIPDSDASIVARAEVKNHYTFNYSEKGEPRWARGMGVKFVEFVEDGDEELARSLPRARMRTLH
jgi:hypothetical protein